MANKNRTGFYPVGTLHGSPWTASVRRFTANNIVSNVCIGSLVQFAPDGTVEVVTGASSNIIGAVVGMEPVAKTTTSVQAASLTLEKIYIPKSATAAAAKVRVVTDPSAIYETITANGTTIGTANLGEQYNILSTAGGQQSPATKPIDASTLDVGNPQINVAAQLVLWDIGHTQDDGTANATYTDVNAHVLVTLMQSMTHAAKATNG